MVCQMEESVNFWQFDVWTSASLIMQMDRFCVIGVKRGIQEKKRICLKQQPISNRARDIQP